LLWLAEVSLAATAGWLDAVVKKTVSARIVPRLGDETDLGQAGAAGGAHGFGHRLVAVLRSALRCISTLASLATASRKRLSSALRSTASADENAVVAVID
jgi:hypothetical protein